MDLLSAPDYKIGDILRLRKDRIHAEVTWPNPCIFIKYVDVDPNENFNLYDIKVLVKNKIINIRNTTYFAINYEKIGEHKNSKFLKLLYE